MFEEYQDTSVIDYIRMMHWEKRKNEAEAYGDSYHISYE